MPRLTRDEAFRLQDRFEEFIQEAVGQDVVIERHPGHFSVIILGPRRAKKGERRFDPNGRE